MRSLGARAGLFVYRLFRRYLKEQSVIEPPPGITVARVDRDEMISLCEVAGLQFSAGNIRAAFSRGEVCVAAKDGGRIVGYCWFARTAAPHVHGVWMDFNPGLIYSYRGFVIPSYRGRRIARSLYMAADSSLRKLGFSRMLVCIASHNSASMRAAQHAGFRRTGWIGYLQSDRRLWLVRTPAVKECGFRFYVPDEPQGGSAE